jgi:hypothetical protein
VVTAKLSQKFYEKVGEDITNELVNWFNAVDATYRADLRDLNEVNFARFDAKLEQRLVELDAKWGTRWSELDMKLEQRLVELDAKWGTRWSALDAKLDQRLVELDAKWGTRWSELDAKLEQRLAQSDAKWDVRWHEHEARLAERFAQLESRLTWRMFAFWAPTALAIIGTSAGVVSLLLRR